MSGNWLDVTSRVELKRIEPRLDAVQAGPMSGSLAQKP